MCCGEWFGTAADFVDDQVGPTSRDGHTIGDVVPVLGSINAIAAELDR